MIRKEYILFVIVLASVATGISQKRLPAAQTSDQENTRDHQVDFTHLKLNVSFVPEEGKVIGDVTHTLTPLRKLVDTLFFNGPGIDIQQAFLNTEKVDFKILKEGVVIYPKSPMVWEKEYKVRFVYEAHPKKGLYFIGWNDQSGVRRKQIWTQGQGIDNRYWIPMYDERNDKMVTELIVSFDSDYEVLSNGELIAKDVSIDGGLYEWNYKISNRHSTYLIMLGIGKYNIDKRVTKRGVPVNLYYYQERKEAVEPTYTHSAEMIDYMEEVTGVNYPWKSYSQIPVEDFMAGAMENTTATLFGDFFLNPESSSLYRKYFSVNVHELTHQWFGDYITARGPKDAWLQEGFASYYPKLYTREIYGEDDYQWVRKREIERSLSDAKSNNNPVVHARAGRRIYYKGSMVLDMLSSLVGEESFNKVIKYYLKKHPYGIVETSDLYFAFQDVLGMNLDWFFDQWLYKGGEPHYRVTQSMEEGGDNILLSVEQIQDVSENVGHFKMPVGVAIYFKDGTSKAQTFWVNGETTELKMNAADKKVDYILFDAGSKILKRLTFERPLEMIKSQAKKADNVLDKFMALKDLRDVKLELKRSFLIELYENEPFYGIKDEIISQLAKDDSKESVALINRAFQDVDMNVRFSAIQHVDSLTKKHLPYAEKLLTDPQDRVVMIALNKLAKSFPKKRLAFVQKVDGKIGKARSLEILCLRIRAELHPNDLQYVNKLTAYAGASYEFMTRMNALNALDKLDYLDDDVLENLFEALTHFNRRLRMNATIKLNAYLTNKNHKLKISEYLKSKEWTVDQMEFLKPLLSGI